MARLALALLLACACSSSTSGRTLDPLADGGGAGTESAAGSAGAASVAGAGGSAHAGGSAGESGGSGALAGAGSGGTAASTGGSGTAGSGGAAEAGAGGETGDPLEPVPAANCPGYFDWFVPEGTCIWVHGRFTQQTPDCDGVDPTTNTCGTLTRAPGSSWDGWARISGTVDVVNPSDVEVTRFELEDGVCPKACAAP